jgi:hypothetical protein
MAVSAGSLGDGHGVFISGIASSGSAMESRMAKKQECRPTSIWTSVRHSAPPCLSEAQRHVVFLAVDKVVAITMTNPYAAAGIYME